MLVTDNLVFIHLHKSGGTFVNQFLLRHGAAAHQIGYHLPYREIPPEYRELPVLGTIRDPFGYYVSWYHFQKGMQRPNPLFRICSNDGTLGFSDTIRALLWLENDDDRLSRLETAVPADYQNHGLNLTKRCVRSLRGGGVGFYTLLLERMFYGATRPVLIPTDRLRVELASVLTRLGEKMTEAALAFIRDVPDLNASAHAKIESYFDEGLRRDVHTRDAPAFNMLQGVKPQI